MIDEYQSSESSEDLAISRLYRATRREQPSAGLDAGILSEAQSRTRRQRNRWLFSISTAAVVLLGITLTLQLLEQAPRLPKTIEDIESDRSTESRSVAPSEERRAMSAPKMMRESLPSSDQEKHFNAQKAAHRRPMPAGMSDSGQRQMEEMGFDGIEQPLMESAEPSQAPVEWLSSIDKQIEAGETERAIQELRAFVKLYPNYLLPEKFQTLLMSRP